MYARQGKSSVARMAQTQMMVLLALIGVSALVGTWTAQCDSGSGTTTRYWDCCKASCSWNENVGTLASGKSAVKTCAKDGSTQVSASTQSACSSGSAYMCANQQPIVINDTLAYGFAAGNVNGLSSQSFCCSCYSLKFSDSALSGKTMIVQVTNTGSDLNSNQFDLQIPGGGVGQYNACTSQYGAPTDGWGSRYGGVSSESDCSQLPSALQSGCKFRFEWFKNANNPSVTFTRVRCPSQLVSITGCQRADEP